MDYTSLISWNVAAVNTSPLEFHEYPEATLFEQRVNEMDLIRVSDLTPSLDYMIAAVTNNNTIESAALKAIVHDKLTHLLVPDFFFNNKPFFKEKWLNRANKEIYGSVAPTTTSVVHGSLPSSRVKDFFDAWMAAWGARVVAKPSRMAGLSEAGCRHLHTLTLAVYELAVNGVAYGLPASVARSLSQRACGVGGQCCSSHSQVLARIFELDEGIEHSCVMLQEAGYIDGALSMVLKGFQLISDPAPAHPHQQSVIYVNQAFHPDAALADELTLALKAIIPDSVVAQAAGRVFASVHAPSDGVSLDVVNQMLDVLLSSDPECVVVGIDANTTTKTAPGFVEACAARGFHASNPTLKPTTSKSRTCLQYQLQKTTRSNEKPDEQPKDFILLFTRSSSAVIVASSNVYTTEPTTQDVVQRMPNNHFPSDHAVVEVVVGF
jgi:hypothetical protein